MTREEEREYRKKCHQRQLALKMRLWRDGLSRQEQDLIELEIMELDIMPGSYAWRWGRKGVLRRARKIMEKEYGMKVEITDEDIEQAKP